MRIKLIVALSLIIAILLGTTIYQNNKIKKQDTEIGSLTNNVRAYEDLKSNNRVLQIKLSDLRGSNDKMIQSLDSTRKALKLIKKDLKQASVIKTSVDTEFVDKIIIDTIANCDFTLNKQLNVETSINIKVVNDSIRVKLNLSNTQYLFVYSKKEYRNFRKNWFDRLFHWDWKKDMIFRYEIKNSNDLIKIEDTRIINIKE